MVHFSSSEARAEAAKRLAKGAGAPRAGAATVWTREVSGYRRVMPDDQLPLLTFLDAGGFAEWLAAQPADAKGAWVKFAKTGAAAPTITKSAAIDCALAYGWIDGQLGRIDEHFFKTRFTPRRPGSAWSQVNRERVERLLREGRMTSVGLAQVEQAQADGRWEAAYAPQGRATPPDDLQATLNATPVARACFDELDAANRYAVIYRVQQTKTPEKRAAKIAELVAMLGRGETFHPRRARRR